MASGIWTSVSGAAAQKQAVDIIANNLANSDTLGFKKDQPSFKEYLSVVEREHGAADIPRGPIKDKDFYPLDGRDQSDVVVDGTYTNFKQGNLRVTQAPLDVAMDGPGFIEVSTPSGIRYTRQGSLKMSMDGTLVTSEGYPVLAAQPGGLAAAQVQPTGQGGPGTQGGVAAGPVSAARFINLRARRDVGGILVLETSNVNPIEEMTHLIQANRRYETDLKAMKTYGELMGREANDIGKL